jgi:hypothetical protein
MWQEGFGYGRKVPGLNGMVFEHPNSSTPRKLAAACHINLKTPSYHHMPMATRQVNIN